MAELEDGAEQAKVVVERMSGLDAWEFYRASDEETDEVVCKIALQCDERAGEVEYAVWRGDEEPSATGNVVVAARSWDDGRREWVLREILATYAEEMPEVKRGVEVEIAPTDEDDGDDFDDEDEDDEDDE
jgi:hypothetical protein